MMHYDQRAFVDLVSIDGLSTMLKKYLLLKNIPKTRVKKPNYIQDQAGPNRYTAYTVSAHLLIITLLHISFQFQVAMS